MRDRPNSAALLDVARWSLLEEAAPTLRGQSRYTTLMVANAIGIAVREIKQADRSARAWSAVLARVTGEDGGIGRCLHRAASQIHPVGRT
jgi:Domain of unknown function (DUF6285)